MKPCFSIDGENFTYNSLAELCADNDVEVGDTYWQSQYRSVTPEDIVSANAVLDDFSAALCDLAGDEAEEAITQVSDDAASELRDLLCQWLRKHVNLSQFNMVSGDSVEKPLVAEDFPNPSAG